MGISPWKISLLEPQTVRINLTEEETFRLGAAPTVPYGTAKLTINTSANWAERTSYIPAKGEIIVYSDRRIIDSLPYPGIKIGDGKAYVVDLPFVGDDSNNLILDLITAHINDPELHVNSGERQKWNNKVSCSIEGERLILEGMD